MKKDVYKKNTPRARDSNVSRTLAIPDVAAAFLVVVVAVCTVYTFNSLSLSWW